MLVKRCSNNLCIGLAENLLMPSQNLFGFCDNYKNPLFL